MIPHTDTAGSGPDAATHAAAQSTADLGLLDALATRLAAQGPELDLAGQAHLLRQLIHARPDTLDSGSVVRFWRLLMAELATRSGQQALSVAVAGPQPIKVWDQARFMFGPQAALMLRPDVRASLEAVLDGTTRYAVLDFPDGTGAGGWWPMLAESRFSRLRIHSGTSLPCSGVERPEAVVVGRGPLGPSGKDDSLVVALDERHQAERALVQAGVDGEVRARARAFVLMRVQGHLADDDPRLGALARNGLDGVRVTGTFPVV